MAQTPPPKTSAVQISLLVNRGESGVTFVMPDLIGVNGDRSADLLRARGFRVAVVGDHPYPGVPAGVVLRQNPQAGFQISPGETDFARRSRDDETILIAPSILAADFAALGKAIADAEAGGADLIHVDVMDGHFVPNSPSVPPVVRSLKKVAKVPLDVHLMIEDPDRFAEEFVQAGAAMLSVHVEVLPHLHRTIQYIKSLGAKAGVAINPSTPVSALEEIAGDVDHVLVMSVNPGFGGQTFIPRSESKIQAIRALLDAAGNPAPIEVDGGVDASNAARLVAAGASILVAGSAIFGGDPRRSGSCHARYPGGGAASR